MKNSKTLFGELVHKIKISECRDEIESLVYLILEHVTGLSRTEIFSEKKIDLNDTQSEQLNNIIDKINQHHPVQYIVGEAEFYGRKFKVDPSVLIPRPETEELVRHTLEALPSGKLRILDIGTGSGCIPITLKLERIQDEIYGCDISNHALDIARENAVLLMANVHFFNLDILTMQPALENLDAVVSNPPYVLVQEKTTMHENVLHHEPHLALFVPDDDPLLFYKAIAEKAALILRPKGFLITEINERFGKEVSELFSSVGFQAVEIIKDISGKERFVKGLMKE
jgi:release factor glutamine methyltransferase